MNKKIDHAEAVKQTAEALENLRKGAVDVHKDIAKLAQEASEDEAHRAAIISAAANGGPLLHDQIDTLNAARAKREERREFVQQIMQHLDASLKRAEARHLSAIKAATNARARGIADKRVEAAKRFDAAAQAMTDALAEWQGLGRELVGLDLAIWNRAPMSGLDNITGANRLAAAFPASVVSTVFPSAVGVFAGSGSLAASEAAQWADLAAD